MMKLIMNALLLAFFLVTSAFATALPTDSELDREGGFGPGFTVVEVFRVNASSGDHQFLPANGRLFDLNPADVPIERICIARNMPACAFGAEDGTWILAANDTDSGCVEMSPPLALNNGFCCISLDDCALLDSPFAVQARDILERTTMTTLTLMSSDNGAQTMDVQSDGTVFSFKDVNSMPLQVCVSSDTMGCVLQAADGTAYTVSSLGVSNCATLNLSEPLDHGFCCKDVASCPGLNNMHSRSPVVDHFRELLESRSLLPRGPVKDDLLHLLFQGAGDLLFWGNVYTTLVTFDVIFYVPWAVDQICMMDDQAICAFTAIDSTVVLVEGGKNSNCATVGPPRVIFSGECCADPQHCNASDHSELARLIGPTKMAEYMGGNATNSTNTTKTTVDNYENTIAGREADVEDVTIEYYGPSNDYALQWVTGDYSLFTPSATWGVDQVCIISPQGYCLFWSADETHGFEVGAVAEGQSGACYTVGDAYILAGGICCRSSDGCSSKRSTKPLSMRDTTLDTAW